MCARVDVDAALWFLPHKGVFYFHVWTGVQNLFRRRVWRSGCFESRGKLRKGVGCVREVLDQQKSEQSNDDINKLYLHLRMRMWHGQWMVRIYRATVNCFLQGVKLFWALPCLSFAVFEFRRVWGSPCLFVNSLHLVCEYHINIYFLSLQLQCSQCHTSIFF